MSQSIFQKLRVITLSNIHTLLDGVKNLNSIGEFEQYLRDLEAGRNMLDDQAAGSRSDVETFPMEIATLQARYKEADENINLFLGDDDSTNDHLAAPLEAQLMTLEAQIASKKSQLETAKTQLAKFEDAVSKLNTTVVAAQGRLAVLRDLDHAAKGQARAEKALSGISIGEMPDMDNVEQRLRKQAAVSGNQLGRTLSQVTSSAGGSTIEATVAARLAKRRQALNQAAEAK